jgi:hypothetical protein
MQEYIQMTPCANQHQKLMDVIAESGMWHGSRKASHGFLLSPSVYPLTKAQQEELHRLGLAIYDCLRGLSHIAVIAFDPQLNYSGAWLRARRIFSTGVPKAYLPLQGMNVKHIPQLLKVDLMVDQEGQFRIAEIDGHNKHGLGYSTLGLRFRKALYPDAASLPGTVALLAEEIKRMGHERITLFYADQERFYIPEFQVAQQEFNAHGIECALLAEMEADEARLKTGLYLDLPFLYHRDRLYDGICTAYRNSDAQFIIPPKPFLGAKGVLAFLRNDDQDTGTEALLRSFIREKSLEEVRSVIPETILVGKQGASLPIVQKRITQKRFVLKESISSGMKGTVFSDGPDFQATLARAYQSNMNWILQEEVVNQPQTFSWYEPDKKEGEVLRTSEDWFMRVTVQYVNRQLGDVIVTARRGKAVHGAPDCLQLGTILVP